MNREIKFRAWHKKKREMLVVGSFDTVDSGCSPRQLCGPDIDTLEYIEVEDCVLLQYTGLKDKNGKEIYEGDVVDNYGGKYLSVVRWQAGEDNEVQNYIAGFWFDYEPDDLEVIGNIYENPELLEKKDV